ncbi:hypothetical protein OG21DRAFT_1495914 [Imleria badia]|nr:hypothetical protein OG21DRAFT_1495914 [Imleria badia]
MSQHARQVAHNTIRVARRPMVLLPTTRTDLSNLHQTETRSQLAKTELVFVVVPGALSQGEHLAAAFLQYRRRGCHDLPVLARTCCTFKEPALEVLWEELDNLSPLVQCLPEASYKTFENETEWDILQSYTLRIRSILALSGLDKKSLKILSNPPTTTPLFPNLRTLYCEYTEKTIPLLHLPLPSVVFLEVQFHDQPLFQNSLELFPNFSPNIRRLFIYLPLRLREVTFDTIKPNYFCRWQNLCSVICPSIALDVDTLVHLSRMPALTQLTFTLDVALPPSKSPLVFSNLNEITLRSESLHVISGLLSLMQLPAMTDFMSFIRNCPSRHDFTSFLAGVQRSSTGRTIKWLALLQTSFLPSDVVRSKAPLLCLDDLRSCMVLNNLRHPELVIEWNVGLTDTELLALVSSWPHLETLYINIIWGWNTLGGITPNGLLQLLQTCRSLSSFALAVDTRGYTELPPSGSSASLGSRSLLITYVYQCPRLDY